MMRKAIPLLLLLAVGPARADEGDGLPAGYELTDRTMAIVDDETVSLFELNRAFAPLDAMSAAILDDKEREEWTKSKRKEVLAEQVNTILVLAEARKLNLEVPPQQVAAHLASIKDENGWDDAQLEGFVKSLGFVDLASYREHVEREMLKAQMINIRIGSRSKPSKEDVERVFVRDNYGGKKQDEVRAAHILVRVPNLVTSQQLRELHKKALEVHDKAITEEKSFDDLAKEYSDDQNASSGGDLGWFKRGMLDPEFERATFKLKVGQISEVVQTGFGYHVIRVTDRRQVPIEDPAQVKRLIQMDLERENQLRGYEAWVKELRLYHHVEERL